MTIDLFKNTTEQLRFALSQEWCDLYEHKTEWNAAVEKAWDSEQEAFKAANDADEAGEEEGKVDALYDIAQALAEERNKAEDRAERLEKAMKLIEQLETLYADDWKEE